MSYLLEVEKDQPDVQAMYQLSLEREPRNYKKKISERFTTEETSVFTQNKIQLGRSRRILQKIDKVDKTDKSEKSNRKTAPLESTLQPGVEKGINAGSRQKEDGEGVRRLQTFSPTLSKEEK